MSNWQTKLSEKLKSKVNIPAQHHILNLPRITMIGSIHVYIENHRGLLRFTSNEIELRVTQGLLTISGRHLVIKMLLTEEILIEGEIIAVTFKESNT
ncbi:sporulation protein YqfC [Amphibacillus sediminis]|uniref:sporulation protein YqfC n=1 Tax=Amphibacillus sediminis TaxID=360185 RepID=UPI00082DBAE4|nr:sporulation protein YqfC [Amphibacillus sediminis]